MRYLITLLIFFFFNTLATSAQETRVLVTEKKQGKRLVLIGENTTKDTLNVFFMVKSEGYRRSADRPTIKFINPGDKIPLITLIELNGATPTYSYTLVVNEEVNQTNITYDKPTVDIEKKITNKLVLFIDQDCKKCSYLRTLLSQNRINHQVFDIDDHPELFRQFNAFIEKKYPEINAVRLPAIWNKNYLLFGFDDATEILNELKK